jgi:hypothetical protein
MRRRIFVLTLLAGVLLVACSPQPQAQATPSGPVVVWERSGGIAGICQRFRIAAGGAFILEDCSDNRVINEGRLSQEQWEELAGLLAQYNAFEYNFNPPQGSADMFTDKYTFSGTGDKIPSPEVQVAINEYLAELATEAAVPTGSAGGSLGSAGQALIGQICPA